MKTYEIEMTIHLPCRVRVQVTHDGETAEVAGAEIAEEPSCRVRDVYVYGDMRVLDDRALDAWVQDQPPDDDD